MSGSSVFLLIEDTLALGCILNSCNTFVYCSTLGPVPQIKKIPLPFLASGISSVLQLLLLPFVSLCAFSGHVHIFASLQLESLYIGSLSCS